MASTTLVFDLWKRVLHPELTDRQTVLGLRAVVFAVCGIGLAIAWGDNESIYLLVLFAWAGIASAFCPTLIMTLFWKGTNRHGVLAGALAGFGTALLWNLLDVGYVYEMVPAFIAAFVATWLVSILTGRAQVEG